MMKTNLIIAAVILSVSCSTNNPESIRKNIISKKEQIARINQSIKKLEEKLYKDSAAVNPQFLIPVKIKNVKYEPFRHYIEVQGNIEAVEQAYISPEMGGQIKKIHVREGQRVKKGQLLVIFFSGINYMLNLGFQHQKPDDRDFILRLLLQYIEAGSKVVYSGGFSSSFSSWRMSIPSFSRSTLRFFAQSNTAASRASEPITEQWSF